MPQFQLGMLLIGGLMSMDLEKIIRELQQRRRGIDQVIKRLEMQQTAARTRNPRGRKKMSFEERITVSKRMIAYWANRRRPSPVN